jgi:hypothetical protein
MEGFFSISELCVCGGGGAVGHRYGFSVREILSAEFLDAYILNSWGMKVHAPVM